MQRSLEQIAADIEKELGEAPEMVPNPIIAGAWGGVHWQPKADRLRALIREGLGEVVRDATDWTRLELRAEIARLFPTAERRAGDAEE